MGLLALIGRILFSSLFVLASFGHFTANTIGFASNAGVPMAGFLVPFAGLIALLGGLSILIGYKARIGAWLIILFLIPVTFTMHKFWGLSDPSVAYMQEIMFMKNIALLGGAFLITYFGAGPISFDARDD